MNDMTDTQKKIEEISNAQKDLLLYKNKKYGNSALEPLNVFFQNKQEEGEFASILIRMDDKLSRIKNRDKLRVNDVSDLIGYAQLLLVKMSEKTNVVEEIQKQKD